MAGKFETFDGPEDAYEVPGQCPGGIPGSDGSDVTLVDNGDGTATLTVDGVSKDLLCAPTTSLEATDDGPETVNPGTPVTINIFGNDLNPEGTPIEWDTFDGQSVTVGTPFTTSDGYYTVTLAANGDATFEKTDDAVPGTHVYNYEITDPEGDPATATVTLICPDIPMVQYCWDTRCLEGNLSDDWENGSEGTQTSESSCAPDVADMGIVNLSSQTGEVGNTAGEFAGATGTTVKADGTIGISLPADTPAANLPGTLTAKRFKRFTFPARYLAYKAGFAGGGWNQYQDDLVGALTVFADGETPATGNPLSAEPETRLNNVHYYHGLYLVDGTNCWGNSGYTDLFRNTFSPGDTGYTDGASAALTNRGINEIEGHDIYSIDAWEAWKRNLVEHFNAQFAAQGKCARASIEDASVNDATIALIRFATVTVDLPCDTPDVENFPFNNLLSEAGNPTAENEWDFVQNGNTTQPISGWTLANLYFDGHNSAATADPSVGTVTIEPSVDGVGGSQDCGYGPEA